MSIFVEMNNDPTDLEFGNWQVRLSEAVDNVSAVLWYFSNPPKPEDPEDILVLPGDLVGYGALIDYARQANQEGSMDKAQEDAENRFAEYLTQEMLPPKYELLTFATRGSQRVDRLEQARARYYRGNRTTQF